MKVKRIIRIIVIIALIALIGLCGIELWGISAIYVNEAQTKDKLSAYRPADQQNRPDTASRPDAALPSAQSLSSVNSAVDTDSDKDAGTALINDTDRAPRVTLNQNIVDLQTEINASVIGWITVPETHIDYPFVSCDDNDYYISRNIYGNASQSGTLFLDQRCAADLSDFNTIIYGHNMRNNTMFGDLPQFADEWFFNNNRSGTLFTQYDTYTLEIFAFIVVASDDSVIYSPNGDNDTFFQYVKENARNYREPDNRANIVTLSTCAYEFTGARIVVLAALKTTNG